MQKPYRTGSLWKCWLQTVDSNPDRIALIEASTGARVAFGDLHGLVVRRAQLLEKSRGRAIAFCLPNQIEWAVFFLAIQKIGAIAMPLDPSYPRELQASVARNLGADFLWRGDKLVPLRPRRRIPEGTCCVKITSGSMGEPKAVACRGRHLIADGRNIIRSMKIRSSDLNLALIPMGHSYGLGNLVMPLILQGTALVCADAFVPHQIPKWIRLYGATVFPSVPPLLRILAETPSIRSLRPLRLAISAGAVLSSDIAKAFYRRFGLRIHNFYGSSETGGITYDPAGAATLAGRGVGKPLAGVRVGIARSGQVRVKSAAVIASNSQWLLPDFGEWNRYGELRLIGRRDRVANVGGKKVHPAEIESALRGMPGVSDALVSVLQEKGRDFLAAAVESSLDPKDLEKKLARRLPSWKLPRRYHVASRLPRTIRGKLDVVRIKRFWLNSPQPGPG